MSADTHEMIGRWFEPRACVCDFCGKPFDPAKSKSEYLKLCLNERKIGYGKHARWVNDGEVMFGLPCCPSCHRKIKWAKALSYITIFLVFFAIVFAVFMVRRNYTGHGWEYPTIFGVILVAGFCLIISAKKIYRKLFRIPNPLHIAEKYKIWQDYLRASWLPSKRSFFS